MKSFYTETNGTLLHNAISTHGYLTWQKCGFSVPGESPYLVKSALLRYFPAQFYASPRERKHVEQAVKDGKTYEEICEILESGGLADAPVEPAPIVGVDTF